MYNTFTYPLPNQHGQTGSFNGVVGPYVGPPPGLHPRINLAQAVNRIAGTPPYQPQSMYLSFVLSVTGADVMLLVPLTRMPPILASNGPALPYNQCNKCHIFHATTTSCPSLASVTDVRLALDGVRLISGGDFATTQRNKGILQMILKQRKDHQPGRPGGSPAYQPQQPSRPEQQPQQQLSQLPHSHQPQQPPRVQPQQPPPPPPQQQSQARLSAPNEDSSESESSSEDESGSESGSASNSQDRDG